MGKLAKAPELLPLAIFQVKENVFPFRDDLFFFIFYLTLLFDDGVTSLIFSFRFLLGIIWFHPVAILYHFLWKKMKNVLRLLFCSSFYFFKLNFMKAVDVMSALTDMLQWSYHFNHFQTAPFDPEGVAGSIAVELTGQSLFMIFVHFQNTSSCTKCFALSSYVPVFIYVCLWH